MSSNGCNRGDGGSSGGGGAVDSVNGNTGVVVLDYADVGANAAFSTVIAPSGVAATDRAAINSALSTLSAAGGGEIKLLEGLYKFDESINFSDYNNVRIIGSGKGTILQPQLGGTWTNSSFIYCEGNIRGLALGIAGVTKGDTQITYSSVANAGAILAGDTLIIEGTDANSLEDAEYHIAAANGNAGTGVVTLKDKIRRTMSSCVVTDSTGDSQNNGLSDVYIDGSVASDATGLIGLQASNSYRMKIERVWIHDFSASNQEALRLNAGIEHSLEDVYIFNCDSYAIRCAVTIGTTLNNIIIDKSNINGVTGGAIHFSFSSADVSFNNVKIYNGSYDGMRITSSTSACRRIKVNGLDVSRCLGTGFYAQGGGDHQLINGSFADVGESAVLLTGATRCQLQYVANRVQFGARLASSASYNYINARISNVTNDGIYSDTGSYNDFTQCAVSGTVGGSPYNAAGTNDRYPLIAPFIGTDTITADVVTSSTSYIDTGLEVTLTTSVPNQKVRLDFVGSVIPSAAGNCEIGYQIDSDTAVTRVTVTSSRANVSFSQLVNVATAGSHTFKIKMKTNGATWTLITSASGLGDPTLDASLVPGQ